MPRRDSTNGGHWYTRGEIERMKIQNCPGYDQMETLIRHAQAEIKGSLWSLYWLSRSLGARNVVELGLREGESTRALLAAARDRVEMDRARLVGSQTVRVVSIDIDGDAYHCRDIFERQGFTLVDWLWEVRQEDSALAGHKWKEGPVDLVFVDTAHTYAHTFSEIISWSPHVRPRGCMAFHDTSNAHPGNDGVRSAILAFLEAHDNWRFEDHPHTGPGDTGFGILWKDS